MTVKPPFLVSYSITRKCNLKCKHCYSDAVEEASPDEFSTREAKSLLDEIASWGVGLLIMDGGEPLCREDFFEIASYASAKGIRVVVGSNGTLIDKAKALKMKESGIKMVAISIDGSKPETHDKFRGEEGSFKKALEGAKACKAVGLPFQFGMVIRKSTLKEVSEMLRMAVEFGASAAEFFDLVQVKRVRETCPEEVLSRDDRRSILEWLAEAQSTCPITIRVVACPMYPVILREKHIQPKYFPSNILKRIPYYIGGCAAGRPGGYITILPNGDVIPCMLLQVKLGNIREQNLRSLWETSPILIKLRSRQLLEGECGECEYRDECGGCRGRAYEETGNFMASDPGCWLTR
jgi:radical SAM protein with 4Fe4S-binding SPASM domain